MTGGVRRNAEAETKTHARRRHDSLLGYLPDLDVALERQWITPQQHDDLRRRVLGRCEFYRAIEEWWHVSWWRRLADLRLLLQQGGPSDWRWGVARLLPFQVFLSMAAMWARVRPREGGPRAVERGRTKKRADQAAL